MKKIVLAGGTGNLGTLLYNLLSKEGYDVYILSREQHPSTDKHVVNWDGEHLGAWVNLLEGAYAVVNLCGKSIQCRFTDENKKKLHDSRILPTRVLGNAMQKLQNPPQLWVNFSGVSLFQGLESLQDESSLGKGFGFLSDLSSLWEQEFNNFILPHTKKVILRMSPLLSRHSGMFAELLPLVKSGLGGKVGSGKQYVSWIHENDFSQLILWLLTKEHPSHIYHACSPYPETNMSFMKTFRQIVGVNFGLPLPSLLAKIGALAKGVESGLLLDSVPVTTKLTIEEGFDFKFAYLHNAIKQLIKQP